MAGMAGTAIGITGEGIVPTACCAINILRICASAPCEGEYARQSLPIGL